MKKSSSEKKEAAPVPPLRSGTAKTAAPVTDSGHANIDENEAQPQPHNTHVPDLKKLKGNCREYCAVVTYVILGIFTMLISVDVIVVAGLASVATKIYDTEQSSRLVAMILLAVTAAVTLSIIIYSIIGTFKKSTKPLHAAGIILIIIAIIQALIIGVAINVTKSDELNIGKSLGDSFRLAKKDNPRHVNLWTATQFDLQCCGVYGPEDYRDSSMPYYFPPNIPISCCPSYDPSKAAYNQERQRELCKVNNTYFDIGCKGLIIEVFQATAGLVIGNIIALIIFEILLTILGSYLIKMHKARKTEHDEEQERSETMPPQK